jgi:hypothetical protein
VYRHDGKSYDFIEEYLLEYRQFPFSEHDDILDCHSQLFDGEFIAKGETSDKPVNAEDEFEWWRSKAIQAKKPRVPIRYILGNKGIRHRASIPAQESFR